jgi:hypothetical protein
VPDGLGGGSCDAFSPRKSGEYPGGRKHALDVSGTSCTRCPTSSQVSRPRPNCALVSYCTEWSDGCRVFVVSSL